MIINYFDALEAYVLILHLWVNYLLILDIFYELIIVVEYISIYELFIYLVILWLIIESKGLIIEIKRFDE